jgi:hypothetical protein
MPYLAQTVDHVQPFQHIQTWPNEEQFMNVRMPAVFTIRHFQGPDGTSQERHNFLLPRLTMPHEFARIP